MSKVNMNLDLGPVHSFHFGAINPKETILCTVNMNEEFFASKQEGIAYLEEITTNSSILSKVAAELGVPQLNLSTGCFEGKECAALETCIQKCGSKTVIFCGVEADVHIRKLAEHFLGKREKAVKVYVIGDASSTQGEDLPRRQNTLVFLKESGCFVTSTRAAIKSLINLSPNPPVDALMTGIRSIPLFQAPETDEEEDEPGCVENPPDSEVAALAAAAVPEVPRPFGFRHALGWFFAQQRHF